MTNSDLRIFKDEDGDWIVETKYIHCCISPKKIEDYDGIVGYLEYQCVLAGMHSSKEAGRYDHAIKLVKQLQASRS
jgi:hypothetical protein